MTFSQRYDINDEICGNVGYRAMRSEAVDLAREHSKKEHGEGCVVVVFDRMHRKSSDGVTARFVAPQ